MAERVLRIQFEGGASSNVDESQAVLNDQITGSQTPGTEAAIVAGYGGRVGKKLTRTSIADIGKATKTAFKDSRGSSLMDTFMSDIRNDNTWDLSGKSTSKFVTDSRALMAGGLAGAKAVAPYAGAGAAMVAISVAPTIANNHINNMATIKGDIAGANELNNVMNGMSKLTSISSMAIGGLLLSGGNPLGAIAGAVAGVTNMTISLVNEGKQINNERTLDAIQSNKSKEALGLLSSNGFRK